MIYNTVSNSTCLRRKELVSQVAENTELLYKKKKTLRAVLRRFLNLVDAFFSTSFISMNLDLIQTSYANFWNDGEWFLY